MHRVRFGLRGKEPAKGYVADTLAGGLQRKLQAVVTGNPDNSTRTQPVACVPDRGVVATQVYTVRLRGSCQLDIVIDDQGYLAMGTQHDQRPGCTVAFLPAAVFFAVLYEYCTSRDCVIDLFA